MPIDRRKFLLLAASGVGLSCLPWLAGRRQPRTVTRTSWALGTDVSLSVAGLSEIAANRALDAAFAEIETVEQTMSLYRPDSQLSELNRERVLAQPHPYLLTVLQTAEQTARETNGAFDITVQPLWDVYAAAKRKATLPTESEFTIARNKIDWRQVKVSEQVIRLNNPAEAITLNGIAQGFALDRALALVPASDPCPAPSLPC